MAIWSRLTGAIAAIGIGGAGAAAVEPVLEVPKQHAWEQNANRILDLGTLAHLVSQGLVNEADVVNEAARNGYNALRLQAMVQLELAGPPIAEALELWRRKLITDAQMRHALDKAQIEQQYHEPIMELFFGRLAPQEIAVMVQRTVMDNPGLLPGQPSSAGSNVPPMPQVAVDPVQEAAAHGIDAERLAALTRIVGLPASADLAARMHFRQIITEGAYNQAILEGNTRGEWAPFLLEGFRQILTVGEYAELQLRGFSTRAERLANTAKHGMSEADSDLLYNVLGRAIPEHAIVTGEARGGTFNGPIDHIPEAFLSALQRGNIRPEYYNLAYANRYIFPSAFVLRSLTEAGDLTEAEAHQILLNVGWPPDLAAKVAARWAGGTAPATADPHVKRAQTQLWTQTHKSYIAHEITEAAARSALADLGVTEPAQSAVIGLWLSERSLIRAELSPLQVAKAWAKDVINPATGLPWTKEDATARLVEMGYTGDDALTLLGEQ